MWHKDNSSRSCADEQLTDHSEKMKRFLEEEPPTIICYGTGLIIVFLIIAGVVYICS